MFGLGKPRSRFGKWIDKHGLKQKEVAKASGLTDDTVAKVCNDTNNNPPTPRTANSLLIGVRKLTGKNMKHEDFWA